MHSFNEAESTTMCRYCGSMISPKDEQAQNVGMFVETQCYHVYHITCFKQYATKICLRYKLQGNEPVFEEPKCAHCNAIVPEMEVRQVFGPEAYEENIEK